jgi:hypothetical protein
MIKGLASTVEASPFFYCPNVPPPKACVTGNLHSGATSPCAGPTDQILRQPVFQEYFRLALPPKK